jgi:hypothetical protein
MSFAKGIKKIDDFSNTGVIEQLGNSDVDSSLNDLFSYLYNHILNPEEDIQFIKASNTIKNLLNLTSRKLIVTKEFFEKLDFYMISKINHIFINFQYVEKDDDDEICIFPLQLFYNQLCNEFEILAKAMYPLFHGLSTTIETENLPKFKNSLSKLEKFKQLNSTGYPVSEIQYFLCQIFLTYCHDHNEKLYHTTSDKMKLANKTVSKLCMNFQLILNPDNEDHDYISELNQICSLYKIGFYLENLTDNLALLTMINKSFFYSCENIKKKLYEEKDQRSTFLKLELIFFKIHHIFKTINSLNSKNSIVSIMLDRVNVIFQSDNAYLIDSIAHLYDLMIVSENTETNNGIEEEKYQENDDDDFENINEKNVRIAFQFFKSMDWDLEIWDIAVDKFTEQLYSKIDTPNEDKLKEMVKFFDQLFENLIKLSKFKIFYKRELVKSYCELIIESWSNHFKRDFIGHYVYYLDYKLKNLPKSKDRIKLEYSIQQLIQSFSLIFPNLSTNQKLRFKKRYFTLLIQRMLNTLFQSEENLFINICDCEEDFGNQLDKFYKINFDENDEINNIIKDMIYAYNKNEEFNENYKYPYDEYSNINIIGLNKKYDLNSDNIERIALSNKENTILKDYKKWIKKCLVNEKRLLGSTKIKLELNYEYSKFEFNYNLTNGSSIILICNMYQGLILQLFNDYDNLGINKISELLSMQDEIVKKNLEILSSKRNPILLQKGDEWVINDEFEIHDKIKHLSGSLVIK